MPAPLLTLDRLLAIVPGLGLDRATLFLPHLVAALAEFEINTPARAAAFLAQAAHESSGFQHLREGLNYSAEALVRQWPNRFTMGEAQAMGRIQGRPRANEEAIANWAYADRLGNGDRKSGDGWRFRGGGIFQLTGRGNYRACGAALGLPLEEQPGLIEQPGPACRSAGWFWQQRGLNGLADAGNFDIITRKINGGMTGAEARREYHERAKLALNVQGGAA